MPLTASPSGQPGGPDASLQSFDSFLEPKAPPANDDTESIGALLKALNQRAPQQPAIWGFVAVAAWIVVNFAFLYIVGRGTDAGLAGAERIVVILSIGAAVASMLATSLAYRRASDAQMTSRCLAKIASDLSDPVADVSARLDAVARQAKGEAAALDGLLNKTFAHAIAHTSLLKTEFGDLEQTCVAGERKLQELIEGLAAERAAIVTHAEKVRAAIAGAHQNLSSDLDEASARFSALISDSSATLAKTIDGKSAEVCEATKDAGERCAARLDGAMASAAMRLTEQVDGSCQRFASVLSGKGEELDAKLSARIKESFALLDRQIHDIQQKASYRVDGMAEHLNKLLERMDRGIGDRGDKISAMLATRTIEIARALKESEAGVKRSLDRTAALTQDFAKRADAFNEQMGVQTTRLNDGVVVPLKLAATALDERGRALSQTLVQRFAEIDTMLTTNATKLAATFDRECDALGASLAKSLTALKTTLDQSAAGSDASFIDHKKKISALLDERLADFAKAMEVNRARILADFEAQAVAVEQMLSGRGKPSLDAAASDIQRAPPAPAPSMAVNPPSSQPVMPAPAVKVTPTVAPTRAVAPRAPDRSAVEAAAKAEAQKQATAKALAASAASVDAARKAAGTEGGSWLTELLARASVDEEGEGAPATAHAGRSGQLSFVASDVEGFVKTDPLKLAWQTYRDESDASLFESIYTPSGATMRLQIKTQLVSDRGLRDAVRDFMSEFERLLQETEADADNDMFADYISSAAGKIYTMLAHASGRLD